MGYVTEAAISQFLEMHPEIPEQEARSLTANPDTSRPLYFWQLYSVLGAEPIVKIVQNLYARIAADKEEPWLPKAFTQLSDWDHHVATQAAFWLDAMGKGKHYHGGEYRLEFHHHHNAHHVMTQQGAARWMHHMRNALDETDLGSDPRVRGTIDAFLHARMEKYAGQFDFQTGDSVYQAWRAEDWKRTDSWHHVGPQLNKMTKSCPVTGQVGECEVSNQQVSNSSNSEPSRPNKSEPGSGIMQAAKRSTSRESKRSNQSDSGSSIFMKAAGRFFHRR